MIRHLGAPVLESNSNFTPFEKKLLHLSSFHVFSYHYKYLFPCWLFYMWLICQQTTILMTWPWTSCQERLTPCHWLHCRELPIYNQDSDQARSRLGGPTRDRGEAGGRKTTRLLHLSWQRRLRAWTRTVTEGSTWRRGIPKTFLSVSTGIEGRKGGERGGENEEFNDGFWGFQNPFSPWPLIFKEKCFSEKKQGSKLRTILPRRKMLLSDTVL